MQESALRATDVDLQDLKAELFPNKVEHLQKHYSDIAQTLKKHSELLDIMADGITECKKDFSDEKRNVSDFMRNIDCRVSTNTSFIDDLERNQHQHNGQLQKADRFMEHLQDGYGKLKEWADMVDQDIKSLASRQQNIYSKLDLHTLEIQNAQADLHQAGKEIDGTNNNLLGLKNEP